MSGPRDDERKALNGIEYRLWTSDPEFYRQFGRAWGSVRSHAVVVPRRAGSALWLLPVGLIAVGVVLCQIVVRSR